MKKNRRDRDEERANEPDMIDGQMLWFLMQQFRRNARRQVLSLLVFVCSIM